MRPTEYEYKIRKGDTLTVDLPIEVTGHSIQVIFDVEVIDCREEIATLMIRGDVKVMSNLTVPIPMPEKKPMTRRQKRQLKRRQKRRQ